MLLLGSLIDSCRNWSEYCRGPMVVSNLVESWEKEEQEFYQGLLQELFLPLAARAGQQVQRGAARRVQGWNTVTLPLRMRWAASI